MAQRLNVPPVEDLVLPAMRHVRVSGGTDPNVIHLEFETSAQGHGPQYPGQSARATIVVPITAVDAAGLLRSLTMLKERGLIPHVPETPVPPKLN